MTIITNNSAWLGFVSKRKQLLYLAGGYKIINGDNADVSGIGNSQISSFSSSFSSSGNGGNSAVLVITG